MTRRDGTLGTPLRGASRVRTPALKILAIKQLSPRQAPLPPRTAAHEAPRRSLHDVVSAPDDGQAPLTLDELLTGWLSSLGASLEPDSFAEFGDYAKHVERMCRAQHAADGLRRALDRRMDGWGHGNGEADTERMQDPPPDTGVPEA